MNLLILRFVVPLYFICLTFRQEMSTKNFNLHTRQRSIRYWVVIKCTWFWSNIAEEARGRGMKTKRILFVQIIKFLSPILKSPPPPIVSLPCHNGGVCVVKRSWELCRQWRRYWQGLTCWTGQRIWPRIKGTPWSSRLGVGRETDFNPQIVYIEKTSKMSRMGLIYRR